jgi:hypothetical protein
MNTRPCERCPYGEWCYATSKTYVELAYRHDVLEVTLQPVDPDGCIGDAFAAYLDLEPAEAARRMLIRQIEAAQANPEAYELN